MHMHWELRVSGDARDPFAALMNKVVPDPFASPAMVANSAIPPGMTFGATPPAGQQAVGGPLDNRPFLKALLAALLPALLGLFGTQNQPAS